MFSHYEVPVAYSMMKVAERLILEGNTEFERYMCYWTAFNNIYRHISDTKGMRPQLKKSPDGSIQYTEKAGVRIPNVKVVKEHVQINLAFDKFSDKLKNNLILHESTKFFIYRTPMFIGRAIKYDNIGQRVNGVINVGYTTDHDHPVWSPIDIDVYEEYLNSPTIESRNELADQILYVLYTIRNNLFHGAKIAGHEGDGTVVSHGCNLLRLIVLEFLSDFKPHDYRQLDQQSAKKMADEMWKDLFGTD